MRSSSPSVFLGVLIQQYEQNVFLSWFGYLRGVSQYTLGTWELKSIVVLSNAQPFKRGLPIYNRVHEVPFDIPKGYVKGRSIYQRYVEEPRRSRVVVQEINDSSYIL